MEQPATREAERLEPFKARSAILTVVEAGHVCGVIEAARQFSAKK